MIKKKVILFFVFYFLSSLLGGCGYTTRSMISDKYKTIYVVPFINRIDITNETYTENKYRVYKPLLETDITRTVIDRYLFDGSLRPAKEKSADLVLKGELMEFRRDPLSFTDSNEVAEYRINILVNISLWDNKEEKLVWQEDNFTGNTTYFTNFSSSSAKISDSAAVVKAVADLARRIVERTVEQW